MKNIVSLESKDINFLWYFPFLSKYRVCNDTFSILILSSHFRYDLINFCLIKNYHIWSLIYSTKKRKKKVNEFRYNSAFINKVTFFLENICMKKNVMSEKRIPEKGLQFSFSKRTICINGLINAHPLLISVTLLVKCKTDWG